jgi:hypothetical protein
MKTRWIVSLLLASGLVVGIRGGCLSKPAPDEQLATHFAKLCDIAHDNVETPAAGVRHLGRYLGNHLDDILGAWGGTIAAIERVEDDTKHDDRARLARARIIAPLRACRQDLERFADAVENDGEALDLIDHASERLSRTLDILTGAETRDLLRQLEQRLEAGLGLRLR